MAPQQVNIFETTMRFAFQLLSIRSITQTPQRFLLILTASRFLGRLPAAQIQFYLSPSCETVATRKRLHHLSLPITAKG